MSRLLRSLFSNDQKLNLVNKFRNKQQETLIKGANKVIRGYFTPD